jgi:hypothetical protein
MINCPNLTLEVNHVMFTDPQTVTINAAAKVMPRVEQVGKSALYQLADETFKLRISHQPARDRVRSMVRLDQGLVVENPLTEVNDLETAGIYVVLDRPLQGFTLAQLEYMRAGLFTLCDATFFAKLFGQES